MKLSKRLLSVVNRVDDASYIIDVGCDHALLDVYLTIYKNCQCLAIDNKKKCILKSLNNIKDLNITLKLQNGIINEDIKNNTNIIMLGLGTSSILKILKKIEHHNIKKMIIQSNNDLYDLRKNIIKMGYYIKDEYIIYEKKIFYTIIIFEKGYIKYSYNDLYIGPILKRNKDLITKKYYLNIYTHLKEKHSSIPNKFIMRKIKLLYHIYIIKKLI